jgi:membrane-bound ClpP family serine protease
MSNSLVHFQRQEKIHLWHDGHDWGSFEIRRWNKAEGQVLINGELWSAVCEVPIPVGDKAVVRGIEGLTLKLKPYENS